MLEKLRNGHGEGQRRSEIKKNRDFANEHTQPLELATIRFGTVYGYVESPPPPLRAGSGGPKMER